MTQGQTPRSDLADRLGGVGIWWNLLGSISAQGEREAVQELEELGYGALWFGEAPNNKEAFSHAAVLLAASRRIVVATGIANIYARDASAMNAASRTLSEAYPDRFLLGLGVSHAILVNPRGHNYGKPLAAMRDYLDRMDASPYEVEGDSGPATRVLAALREKMLMLARNRAAGAHPYFVPIRHTVRARELLGPDAFLAPEQAVLLETDPARARAVARDYMAFYLGQPNYANALIELGYAESDIADGGSDQLVDDIVAWGNTETISERVRAHHAAGADHVALQPIGVDVAGGLATLRALSPALLGS